MPFAGVLGVVRYSKMMNMINSNFEMYTIFTSTMTPLCENTELYPRRRTATNTRLRPSLPICAVNNGLHTKGHPPLSVTCGFRRQIDWPSLQHDEAEAEDDGGFTTARSGTLALAETSASPNKP